MKIEDNRLHIEAQTWATPGKEQTLADLISLFESRGVVILQVDEEHNRVLVSREEETIG